MDSIYEVMSHDHKRCDRLFSDAENAVNLSQWHDAEVHLCDFIHAMTQHFDQEEKILFPAFEQATGNSSGPSMMMRHEHQQMRELMQAMHKALEKTNREHYFGLSETLLIFMQQHNMKEEQILYPMIDRTCADQRDALMKNFPPGNHSDVA